MSNITASKVCTFVFNPNIVENNGIAGCCIVVDGLFSNRTTGNVYAIAVITRIVDRDGIVGRFDIVDAAFAVGCIAFCDCGVLNVTARQVTTNIVITGLRCVRCSSF